MQTQSRDVAGPLHLADRTGPKIIAARTRIEVNLDRAERLTKRHTPAAGARIREALNEAREAAHELDVALASHERSSAGWLGWAFAAALLLAWLLSGCVTGPDGRRVLSPVAKGLVEHVLACGLPVAAQAAAGGQPDYLEASRCHLELVGEQVERARPAPPDPEHGQMVVRAAELEQAGAPPAKVRAAAVQCEQRARAKLAQPEAVSP